MVNWLQLVRYVKNVYLRINPRLTGVSAERHWPGGGGAYNAPPG